MFDFGYAKGLFEKYGFELTAEQFEKLKTYAEFLVEYNKNVNLTAITEGSEILKKHFLDSVLMLKYAEIPKNAMLIDVGTGAGFPSVPIKIFRPDIHITLLDSLNKRIAFLQLLCGKLGIEAEFIHSRAEDCGKRSDCREKYDISCARAVANMSVLSELCVPFLKEGGRFIAMKGQSEDVSEADNALNLLGGRLESVVDYDVEGDLRRLVTVKKISQTSAKYPRNSSQIKKNPL